MPLIFNLIIKNYTDNIKKIIINVPDEITFSKDDFIIYFNNLNLSFNIVQSLNFMINTIEIKNNIKIKMSNKDIVIINVLTNDFIIKDELIKFFNLHGCDVNINNTEPKLENNKISKSIDKNIINEQNKITLKIFNDPDFRFLIKIYLTRPELFNNLLQYTQSGDVIPDNIDNNLSSEELNELLHEIKKLNLNISDEKIINILIKCNGHLNLTIRALLCDIAKN